MMKTSLKLNSIQKTVQLLIVLLLILTSSNAVSQLEIGGRIGGSNYLGDSSPILPVLTETKFSYGFFVSYHLNQNYAIKGYYNDYTLSGSDAHLSQSWAKARNLSFQTSLTETGLGIEYYFKDFNKCAGKWSPYVFIGGAYINYAPAVSGNISDAILPEQSFNLDFAIPMAVGVKKAIYKGLTLGAQLDLNKTFSDNLDYDANVGNAKLKDWYLFGGVTLSYIFGRCGDNPKYSEIPCPNFKRNYKVDNRLF